MNFKIEGDIPTKNEYYQKKSLEFKRKKCELCGYIRPLQKFTDVSTCDECIKGLKQTYLGLKSGKYKKQSKIN